jgi:hypothetical protein
MVSTTPTAVGESDLLDIILELKRERNLARAGRIKPKGEDSIRSGQTVLTATLLRYMLYDYSLKRWGE